MATPLRIGILVDSLLKQQYLATMVAQSGHSVCFRGLLSLTIDELPDINNAIDAWVIDTTEDWSEEVNLPFAAVQVVGGEVDGEDVDGEEIDVEEVDTASTLDYLLEQVTVPVILSDSSEHPAGSNEHSAWLRRMAQRLQRLSGDINLQQAHRAPYLWVLAASTGGPAAVKEFFAHLPGELGIAFVYVQHIDANYAATLIRMMSNAGRYPAALASDGSVLQRDSITLVTAERRVDILENGTLTVTEEPWGGCYAPSIDQVVANVARSYRERCGLIIFSGMGDDGAGSSRLIKQQGGQVWVQQPDSCASSSMPEAALATKCVNFSGTPKELAQQLTQHLIQKTRLRTALP